MKAFCSYVVNTRLGDFFVFRPDCVSATKKMTSRSQKRPAGEPNTGSVRAESYWTEVRGKLLEERGELP